MTKSKVAKRRRATRTPGRPSATSADDVKAALLDTAAALFLQHGFAKVSSRQIAAAAHTTPAMIHYYFGDKRGLFREILQRAVAPFTEQLMRGVSSSEAPPDPAALINGHMRTAAANAWLGPLIINEVFAEGGQLRADFIRDFASRFAPMIIQMLERARAAGQLRRDLDPRLATLSFLSLCVFPLISRAITGPVLGIRLEGPEFDRLVEHTMRVFLQGCGNHER